MSSDTINIESILCDCDIYVPNSFTPNHDNLNDKFQPYSNCEFIDYNLMIFNRWGEKIYETTRTNISWDGTLSW